ncbi:MAG: hypothetical protein ACKVQR_19750 [Aquabacterium sp.]
MPVLPTSTPWTIGLWGRPESNAAKVASHLASRLQLPVVDYFSQPDAVTPASLLLVTPNMGDGEIPEPVEWFVRDRCATLTRFGVVEIGNFYGFDDWGFGAGDRIRKVLAGRGLEEGIRPLSLDTLPQIDWDTLERWCTESAHEDIGRG